MTTITIPDSAVARGAVALATRTETAFLVNHSYRTFRFGAELLTGAGRTFDAELLFVASMLHDIALGTELDDGVTPFQLRGAGIAGAEVLHHGGDGADATIVYDAIALHMELSTADDTRPEVAGVHLGAAADVVGLRVDQLSPGLIAAVLDEHPRLGMKDAFSAVIAAEAEIKPYSSAAVLVRDLAFVDLICAAPFDE